MSFQLSTARLLSVGLMIAVSSAVAQTPQISPKKPPAPARPAPPRRIEANIPTLGITMLPGPRLKLKEGPAVDGVRERLDRLDAVNLGPNGQMAVRINYNTIGVFDSIGRRLWRIELGRGGDLGNFGALGWRGSEMWISDRRFAQIALMDRGTVAKSLEIPTWIRPAWNNRKTLPVFGQADILGLFADGSMVLIPYNPHSLMGEATEYDSTMVYVVRTTEAGLVQNIITKYHSFDFIDRGARIRAYRGDSGAIAPRIAAKEYWPRLRISSDGARIVTVTVDTTHPAIDTIVVEARNDRGVQVFTRKFGFPRKEFSEAQIDSIAAVRYSRSSPADRAMLAKGIPRNLPSVRDVVLGRDYSVWVAFRSTNSAEPIVGLDGTGQPIGTTYVPETFQLKAADRGILWIADYRISLKDIVRYTMAKQ
jgi:hypothetical protein